MNILMALSQLEVTGAEVYATTICDELIKRGNKVVIVSDTLTTKTQAEYIKICFNQRKLKNRIEHVKALLKIIKEHDIQVVHANSRASSWSCALACAIARIPLITTTHGRQPVHLSRKIIKAFGQLSICVCENIQKQICNDLGFDINKTRLIRNPVNAKTFEFSPRDKRDDGIIKVALIGRLSGPKGEVAKEILHRVKDRKNIQLDVIGGKDIPDFLQQYTDCDNINFVGYVSNVNDYIKSSDVVIGAGRVAIEACLCGRPVIAVGEAIYEGPLNTSSIAKALCSNFGDINTKKQCLFNFENLITDIKAAASLSDSELLALKDIVIKEFNLSNIVDSIEKIYSHAYVVYKKYEMPVIMYHRVICSESEKGVHGTYISKEKFIAQMQYLKDHNYKTVTFKDLADNRYKERFNKGNKYVILTFDDGYTDNYTTAFPILKEFGFKAVIFLLSDATYNKWDADNKDNPEKKLPLMSEDQIQEMMDYGIEFGIHTRHHPRLHQISLQEATDEILKSKEILESRYQIPFITFAYPYGDLNEEVKEIVRSSGVTFAVATDSGDISFDSDLMQIRRIGIFPGNSLSTFKRKVSGWYNFRKMKREMRTKKL